MKDFLMLLLSFFRPSVDDPAAADPQDQPTDDPQPELDLDAPADEPAPEVDPKEELETARREAREAKEKNERYERELQEARQLRQPMPGADDDLQRIINDPNADKQVKWKAEADLVLRQNTRVAQGSLAQAQDVADRTAFTAITMTDATAKKYETRVEEYLANARRQGANPSRENIYTYLLGKDMREGKFKKKTAPTASGKPASPSTVARGKLPGARSDVGARGGLSERDKRIERLRNQQI